MSIFDYITGLNPHLQQNEMIKNIAMPRMNMSNEDYNVISAMNAADNMNSGLMTLSAPATLYSLGDYAKNLYSDAVNQGYMGSPEITDTDIPVDGNFPEFKRSQDFRETMGDLGRYLKGVNIQSNPELAKQLMGEDYVNKMQGKYALAMDEIGQGIFGIGPDPSLYGSPSGITTVAPQQTFQDYYSGVYEPYDPEKDDYQVRQIQGPEKKGIAKLMEVLGNIPTPLNLFRKAFEGVGPGFIGPKGSRAYGDESLFSTFGRSRTGAEFFQNMRDRKARQEAAARGAAKQADQARIDAFRAIRDSQPSGGGGGGGIGSSYGGAASPGSKGPGGSNEMGSF
jgi:hypothetical protein